MTTSPLTWIGGKFRLAKKLVELFPPHHLYVEVFGGAAHVLFRKEPSPVEIYNDIDGRLVNFFRVVQDKEKCEQLCDMLRGTLYSREIFEECRDNLNVGDDVTRAFRFAVANKQSFGAKMGTWGVTFQSARKLTSSFRNMLQSIEGAFRRLNDVGIENSSFEYILNRYDRGDTFFYLDPPYPFVGERGKGQLYDHEMTNDDHARLVAQLLTLKSKAMLSGYDTPLYAPLEEAG